MLTEKDYCDDETSRELKELGFVAGLGEEGCECCLYDDAWHDQVDRPLLYEAQKWLREEKHIDVLVYLDDLKGYFPFIRIWEGSWKTFISLEEMEGEKVAYSANYGEALSEGVRASIKILQDEQKENN